MNLKNLVYKTVHINGMISGLQNLQIGQGVTLLLGQLVSALIPFSFYVIASHSLLSLHFHTGNRPDITALVDCCLLYTSDAADES